MAKKINKCFSGHFYEKQIRCFFYLYFFPQNTDEATLFSSLKKDRWGAFETDEGGAWETINFFFLSDWNFKKYSVVLVMYSWVQGFL